MTILKPIYFASVLVLILLSTATAQDGTSTVTQKSSLTITANAAGDRMRITAPSSVVQMHVEVYASSGEKLFDQEIRGGNVFDWHLQDGQAQRLAPGAYVCVVTAKTISGKLTQKIGAVNVAENSARVRPGNPQQLSLPQTQAIGPVEADSSWTIAGENEPQTPTVIANNGTDGQMIRGRGALTFRLGNFFSGIDQEQMRLTESGDLGIGTSEPKAKLDVAGTIRAERFLVVKPKLAGGDKTAAGTQTANAGDSVQPLTTGAGTQNQIAKWTDNLGTLGDSSITETAGNVGIGTASPVSRLEVNGGYLTVGTSATNKIYADADGTGAYLQSSGISPLRFYSGATEVIRILNSGRVGIGTTSPTSKLEVNGGYLTVGSSPTNKIYADADGIGAYLQSSGISPLRFYSGATEAIRILNSGNVGIGTATPAEKLTVQTAKGFYGFTHLATDANGANPIALSTYVGGSASGATGGWFGTKTNHDLYFFTNGGQPSMTL